VCVYNSPQLGEQSRVIIHGVREKKERNRYRYRDMEALSKMSSSDIDHNDDEEVMLPGFRFHPTDEELVGFYLRRKVEKKPLRFELIKQIDIYKYDPWDLPSKTSCSFQVYIFTY
jgi:hypothetical protein